MTLESNFYFSPFRVEGLPPFRVNISFEGLELATQASPCRFKGCHSTCLLTMAFEGLGYQEANFRDSTLALARSRHEQKLTASAHAQPVCNNLQDSSRLTKANPNNKHRINTATDPSPTDRYPFQQVHVVQARNFATFQKLQYTVYIAEPPSNRTLKPLTECSRAWAKVPNHRIVVQ